MNQMDPADRELLKDCESAFTGMALKQFVEVAAALKEIRDARLYHPAYASFDEYCRDRWGLCQEDLDGWMTWMEGSS